MLRLDFLKKKGKSTPPNLSPAYLRVQKDLAELALPDTCTTIFPDPDDLFNFKLIICLDEGYYKNARIVFSICIHQTYPHDPPKIKCETRLYHPNVDSDGNICLNILREDWNPVLTLNTIVYGLQHLLLEPNPEEALNEVPARILQMYPDIFQQNVISALEGFYVDGVRFELVLKK